MYRVTAIIAAGGTGSRMGESLNKQYLKLREKPVLAWTLETFEKCDYIKDIIIAVGSNEREFCKREIVVPFGISKTAEIVPGGSRRQDSVYNGLLKAEYADYVVVHDGARPLLTSETLCEVIEAAFSNGGAAAAVPVKDTIKLTDENNFVIETLNRENLWSIQTPQVFEKKLLIEAYEAAESDSLSVTDDSMLVERLGHPVKLVYGDYENIKITTPDDLEVAASILKRGESRK